MEPRQLVGVAERKLRELVVPRLPLDFEAWYDRRVPDRLRTRPDPFVANTRRLADALGPAERAARRERARQAAAGTPTFLNRRLAVATGEGVQWYDDRLDQLPRLWRLKLYAFEPLRDAVLGVGGGTSLPADQARALDGWLRSWTNDVGLGGPSYLRRAWAPYAVSLRIQHWLRYLSWRATTDWDEIPEPFIRALYRNVLFLLRHVERDVGGNHLIENGAALVAAGVFFPEHGRRFLDAGRSVLAEAATEQFLDDGCHFERSPMYHVLCLTRLLTVRDLLSQVGASVPAALTETATAATAFLRWLRPPDGELPLLNDSVHGEALPVEACLRYADAVGISEAAAAPQRVGGTDSGYRRLDNEAGALLVDGGPAGPPHLPGHAHSDTLSILLWLDGRPVVTDTGTFDYEAGPRRQYARGVRGHNTVQVGDAEPIPLGGRFLMGPRPTPETRYRAGSVSLFEGRYRGAPADGAPYLHHRAVYGGDSWWLLQDTVEGADGRPVCGRLHLHPDIEPASVSKRRVRLDTGTRRVTVATTGSTRLGLADGQYFPRFGVSTTRPVLKSMADDPGPESLRLLICAGGLEDGMRLQADGRVPRALTVSGETHGLPPLELLG